VKISNELEARGREIEVKYDALKAPLYELRSKLISGEVDPAPDTEQVFIS